MNKKFIIIYIYHDTFYDICNDITDLQFRIAQLKKYYENDNDFKYIVFYGQVMECF